MTDAVTDVSRSVTESRQPDPIESEEKGSGGCHGQLSRLPYNVPQTDTGRVLEYVNGQDRWVNSWEISRILGIKRGSVRKYLQRLTNRNQIRKIEHGLYCHVFTPPPFGCDSPVDSQHSVGYLNRSMVNARSPMIHNLRVNSGKIEGIVKHEDVELDFFDCHVVITYGVTHSRISWTLACSEGVDLHAYLAIRSVVENHARSLGISPSAGFGWMIVNNEVINQGEKVRLEGAECLTVQVFEGSLFKIYNHNGAMRAEYRSSTPVPEAAFVDSLARYAGDASMAIRVGAVENRMESMDRKLDRILGGMSGGLIRHE